MWFVVNINVLYEIFWAGLYSIAQMLVFGGYLKRVVEIKIKYIWLNRKMYYISVQCLFHLLLVYYY